MPLPKEQITTQSPVGGSMDENLTEEEKKKKKEEEALALGVITPAQDSTATQQPIPEQPVPEQPVPEQPVQEEVPESIQDELAIGDEVEEIINAPEEVVEKKDVENVQGKPKPVTEEYENPVNEEAAEEIYGLAMYSSRVTELAPYAKFKKKYLSTNDGARKVFDVLYGDWYTPEEKDEKYAEYLEKLRKVKPLNEESTKTVDDSTANPTNNNASQAEINANNWNVSIEEATRIGNITNLKEKEAELTAIIDAKVAADKKRQQKIFSEEFAASGGAMQYLMPDNFASFSQEAIKEWYEKSLKEGKKPAELTPEEAFNNTVTKALEEANQQGVDRETGTQELREDQTTIDRYADPTFLESKKHLHDELVSIYYLRQEQKGVGIEAKKVLDQTKQNG